MASARAAPWALAVLLVAALCYSHGVEAVSPPTYPPTAPPTAPVQQQEASTRLSFEAAGLDPTTAEACANLTVLTLDTLGASLLPALARSLSIAVDGLPRSERLLELMPAAVAPCRTLQGVFDRLWDTVEDASTLGCFGYDDDASGQLVLQPTANVGLVEGLRDIARALIDLSITYCNGDIPGDWGWPSGYESLVVAAIASADVPRQPLSPSTPAVPKNSPSDTAPPPPPEVDFDFSDLDFPESPNQPRSSPPPPLFVFKIDPDALSNFLAKNVRPPDLHVIMWNSSHDSSGRLMRGRPGVQAGGQMYSLCERSVSTASAHVLCRQLGYAGGILHRGGTFGEATSPFLSTGLNCAGPETNIADCPASATTSPECTPEEAVGVVCYPAFSENDYCSDAAVAIARLHPAAPSHTAPTASRCGQLLASAAEVSTVLANAFPGMPLAVEESQQLPGFKDFVAPLLEQWITTWSEEAAAAGCRASLFPTARAPSSP
ncbi:hypothetical protein HYH03_001996 [Edaphochlamys debaryana]|uniref:SRCR domain-containing protein n=1 Tax=Edaphochlamys debaryana TaxID=47281 RepID=A0A836C676_9CHLO|nr:hypothetical protein HYH03_001996 [Edaphochlamys debaryana]|eukprot:KAG2500427.1 hypothetical protein HYH03_001996 [Edaphochlamys debaryana]